MFNSSNIILMVIIGLLVIFLMFGNKDDNTLNPQNEKFSGIRAQPIYRYKYKNKKSDTEELIDDVISWDSSLSSANITKEVLNQNYVNIQFHNDYRDVITAIG